MSIRIDGTNTTANPGITGADTDTGLQFGTNEVKVVTDGSDRVTVDSDGRLLAGTTSNSGNFRAVFEANAGNSAAGGDLLLARGSETPLNGQALGLVGFSDNTHTNSAQVQCARDGGTWSSSSKPTRMIFSTCADGESSPTERLRITSDGTIRLASGCPGIDFSQLQTNVSGMQSETLSGYEEGTFTPRLRIENGGDVTVYSNKKGCYVKVGSTVTAWFNLTVDGTPSNRSTSNAIEFHDLPFTSTNDNDNGGVAMYIGSIRINGVNTGSTYNDMSEAVIRLNPNNTMGRIELREASTSQLRNSSLFLTDNTTIHATITYRTDA